MKTFAISTGDPAGIGPEVSVAAIAARPQHAYRVFGDARRLEAALPARTNVELVDVARWDDTWIDAHAPSAEGGRAQLLALDAAIDVALKGAVDALVTAPVSKEAIVESGTDFVGHTERLAERAGLEPDAVTMLFLGPRLSVGLVTTHLSVVDAANAITVARVKRTFEHLREALCRSGIAQPTIWVAGLNPHAGEGGLFGREEIDAITPALIDAPGGIRGPVASEAAFRAAASGIVDGVVAMLHDQATIASKLLDWGAAVNVTWGLPFVRTSVDHGVAYEAARDGSADPAGMIAAIDRADALTEVHS